MPNLGLPLCDETEVVLFIRCRSLCSACAFLCGYVGLGHGKCNSRAMFKYINYNYSAFWRWSKTLDILPVSFWVQTHMSTFRMLCTPIWSTRGTRWKLKLVCHSSDLWLSWQWTYTLGQASDEPLPGFSVDETDSQIKSRLSGQLQFLDGQTLLATLALNKRVRKT